MARKIIYKNNGLNNQPDSPTGYKFVGYDNDTFSEKDGSIISAIGGTGGGSNPNIIEKTYLELTTMMKGSKLDPGQLYLMNDFQTIYDQPDYSDADTPKTIVETKTAAVNPIILLAISENEFAKEVWRPSTPRHTLEYDIRFSQTEVMRKPTKGRITYCKDEFDNETHYDHIVILLKRYGSVSEPGIFNSFWDTELGSTETLTFGKGSISNKIGDNYYKLTDGVFAVSNNVLGADSLGNIINSGSNNNTFGNNTQGNIFGGYTSRNTFGNNTQNNTFGNNTENNTFGDNTSRNTFGNNTQDNIFGGYTRYNTFGDNTQDNAFGNNTQNNTFGDYTRYNAFRDYTRYNAFGDDTENNTFGDYTQDNTFVDNIYGIDFTITPTPTHIYGNYHCNIFRREGGTIRLSYYDNTDTLVVVGPTA